MKHHFTDEKTNIRPGAAWLVSTLVAAVPGFAVHGQQAEAIAVVANGQVSNIALVSGGGGYVASPGVTLVGGGGWGATAEATLSNRAVTQILVRNAGSNYATAPSVIVTPPIDFGDGLLGWWRGDGNSADELGRNNGTVFGSLGYATGIVGESFGPTGWGFVSLGTKDVFGFERGQGDFTIMLWALRHSAFNVLLPVIPLVTRAIYRSSGWALWVTSRGELAFSIFPDLQVSSSYAGSGALVFGDGAWHHVALTRGGDRLALYYDGQVIASTNTTIFPAFAADLEIGAFANFQDGTWPSLIDEVSIYGRALRPEEIKGEYERGSQGKYLRPIVVSGAQGGQWYLGQSNALSVAAIGSAPLSYQWSKNGVPIAGATNATLAFATAQFLDGGVYTATVWNSYGSATSPPATVTVTTAGLSLGLVPKLTITGVTGRSYAVQYTTNLTEPAAWTALTNLTLTAPVQVLYDFDTDTTAPDKPQRYYRVIPGQP